MKSEYRKRGFQEVMTPNVYNAKLWMTSGHWDHYAVKIIFRSLPILHFILLTCLLK